MALSTGLKPCPFCGCEKIDIRERKTVIIECQGCYALFIKSTRSAAIYLWNKRNDLALLINGE